MQQNKNVFGATTDAFFDDHINILVDDVLDFGLPGH